MYDFGLRLKSLREEKKLTPNQVSKRLNLSISSIYNYENNLRQPTVGGLTQLALLYGTTADYLLGIENREFICVDGLTYRQKEIMNMLLLEYKHSNNIIAKISEK